MLLTKVNLSKSRKDLSHTVYLLCNNGDDNKHIIVNNDDASHGSREWRRTIKTMWDSNNMNRFNFIAVLLQQRNNGKLKRLSDNCNSKNNKSKIIITKHWPYGAGYQLKVWKSCSWLSLLNNIKIQTITCSKRSL